MKGLATSLICLLVIYNAVLARHADTEEVLGDAQSMDDDVLLPKEICEKIADLIEKFFKDPSLQLTPKQ